MHRRRKTDVGSVRGVVRDLEATNVVQLLHRVNVLVSEDDGVEITDVVNGHPSEGGFAEGFFDVDDDVVGFCYWCCC